MFISFFNGFWFDVTMLFLKEPLFIQ